ncbi:MAG TPA: hypothetical protein VMU77_00620, partial [Acidimicrobiales bacterium]|nr:hypothetical protein [Acidimicrobiales bacterium]
MESFRVTTPSGPSVELPAPDDTTQVSARSDRAHRWAGTMDGFSSGSIRAAHQDESTPVGPVSPLLRQERESMEEVNLA